jgi:hypothetical protein
MTLFARILQPKFSQKQAPLYGQVAEYRSNVPVGTVVSVWVLAIRSFRVLHFNAHTKTFQTKVHIF